MANIHQDKHSIRNMQVLTLLTLMIFKTFFCLSNKDILCLFSKNKLNKINLRVRFLQLKIEFFGGFENYIVFQFLNHTRLQKVEYLLNKHLCMHTRAQAVNVRL